MTRKHGVAVIGAAGHGMNLVRNFNRLRALSAVCEKDNAVLRQLGEQYPEAKRVAHPNEIIDDPTIGAVAVAGPLEHRASLVATALEAGKHVLAQRPLLCEDAAALVALAEEKGKVLMVDHVLNYHPAFLELQALVAAGELGQIRTIYSERTHHAAFRHHEHPVYALAPNDLAMILALADTRPVDVTTVSGSFRDGIPEVNHTHLNLGEGLSARTFVSWLHPFRSQRLVVVGTTQTAVFDETLPWREKLRLYRLESNLEIPNLADAEPRDIALSGTEPLHTACEHFLTCIDNGDTPRTGGRFALDVIQTLEKALRSLEASQHRYEQNRVASEPRPETPGRAFFAHPTAVIDEDVTIGEGSRVWHFSHIREGSRLGEQTTVGQNVMIGPDVSIGSGCKIQNNVSVFEGVRLEDNVFCGPGMVFTNVLVPRAEISQREAFVETVVREGVTIGANATVLCGRTLGRYAFVGAGAVVTHDVPAHAMVYGNPAVFVDWVCCCGHKLSKKLICRECGKSFVKDGEELVEKRDS